jgi:hypothetical protein
MKKMIKAWVNNNRRQKKVLSEKQRGSLKADIEREKQRLAAQDRLVNSKILI